MKVMLLLCSTNKACWLSFMYENNEAFASVEIIIAKSQYMHVHYVTFVLIFPESCTTIHCHYEKKLCRGGHGPRRRRHYAVRRCGPSQQCRYGYVVEFQDRTGTTSWCACGLRRKKMYCLHSRTYLVFGWYVPAS